MAWTQDISSESPLCAKDWEHADSSQGAFTQACLWNLTPCRPQPGRWAPGDQPLADVVGSEKLRVPLTTAPLAAAPLFSLTFLKSLQIPIWPTQITPGHRERMQRLKFTETEGPARVLHWGRSSTSVSRCPG